MSVTVTVNTKGLDEKLTDIRKMFSYESMAEISNEALNFFIDSFNSQGFTDQAYAPWQKSLKDNGATLVLSGQLRNSLHVENITSSSFSIVSNLPYSEIHNSGGILMITDKMRDYFYAMYKKTDDEKWLALFLYSKKNSYITIPKRQFMGESAVLLRELLTFIEKNHLT